MLLPAKNFTATLAVLLVLSLVPSTSLLALTESSNYIISDDVFGAGGIEGNSSANYQLSDTLAEAIIRSATTTSSTYGIKEGFRELEPDEVLTFSLGASSVNLGALSSAAARTGSHTMIASTNSTDGLTVTVSGTTLTKGADTVTAIGATAGVSTVGTEQFGLNLVANTSPSVGANPSASGSPLGAAADQYNQANRFAFSSGSAVATSTSAIYETTYTVSYLTNIAVGTEPGIYTTTLTYTAVVGL